MNEQTIFRTLAAGTLALALATPTHANDVGGYIRDGQRQACEREGGTYSYPHCRYPNGRSTRSGSSVVDQAIGGVIVGLIGFGICRAAGGCGAAKPKARRSR